jgi:26S proteasome regulatory subunit N5
MFQKCFEYVEQVSDRETKEILLNAVRTNTEGKVYVEVERARATRALATFKELDCSFKEAFEMLQEVAVETFSSMERKEKYDFILEQMRLALITEQFNQAQIISRKINPKIFINDTDETLKVNLKFVLLVKILNIFIIGFKG